MPSVQDLLPETPEDERIRKWREERHRVAETEKAERLRQREIARALEADEQAAMVAAEAAKLLPSEEEIATAAQQLQKQHRSVLFRHMIRFSLICFLPFVMAAYYLRAVATPLYEAKSVIAVTKPSGVSETTTSGLLGSLNSPSNMQEVFMAHEFIQSKAMMDTLETEIGFVTTLSSDRIDPIQRLRDVAVLNYSKQAQFSRFVESAVDIQTGLITLYVRTSDPATAVTVSDTILKLVAAQVNTLNVDVIDQRRALADQNVRSAQQQLTNAQTDLTGLQLRSGEADPAERISSVYAKISQLENDALAVGHDIQKAEVAGQKDSFQTQRAIELLDRIEQQIAEQRTLLVSGNADGGLSLNALMMEHQLALLRVNIAEEALTASLSAQSDATQAAALSRSLFQVVVPPRTADIAGAPNAPAILIVLSIICFALFALWTATFARGRVY